jgi:hypothetical protein
MIFRPPWKTLAPMLVPVISPKVLEEGLLELGLLKLGWFNTLKASKRKSRFTFSVTGNMREIWLSNWKDMGPFTEFLLTFPKVPRAGQVFTEVEADAQMFVKAAWLR